MKRPTYSKPEKALIRAEDLIKNDHVLRRYNPTRALLAFIGAKGMSERFLNKNGTQVPASPYWNTWVLENGTVLAGPVIGGPLCAVIIEELAAVGVKNFIGFGYSGTLDSSVPQCSIMVAYAGLNSDGTTREYTKKREIPGDPEMLKRLHAAVTGRGLTAYTGKVWTMDAIYREFPSMVARWKNRGARFVNMETSIFYAAAREKGAKAGYISVVSDNVYGKKWSGWFADYTRPLEQMYDICLEVADSI